MGTATNFRTAVYHGTEVRTAIRTAIYRVYYFKVKCVSGRHDGSSGPRDTQRDSPTEIRTASLSRVDWFLSSAPLTAWLHAGASTGPKLVLKYQSMCVNKHNYVRYSYLFCTIDDSFADLNLSDYLDTVFYTSPKMCK